MTAPGFYKLTQDGARITLRVTPNARTETIEGPETRADGTCALKLRVTAPPDKGAANAAIIALLARTLGRPKSSFSLLSGHTSRTKVILLAGSPEEIAPELDALGAR